MNPEVEARKLLADHGITEPPVPVETFVPSLGARLSTQPLQGDISGMLYRDGVNAIVGVNSADSPTRQRFTIAHELGHLLMHEGRPMIVEKLVRVNLRRTSTVASEREEREANQFAAELLMPEELVRREVTKLVGEQSLVSDRWLVAELAKRFDVSGQAMEYRLVNLKVLAPMVMGG